jgi:hypothetical protein
MHRVTTPGSVTRALGVYEWTGDRAKPTAARLIPVSLFINGHFEDAAIYLSRPVPLALLTGTAYELQTSGVHTGYLDLAYARNLKSSAAAVASMFDDGWFGYGKLRPAPKPRPQSAKKGDPQFASRVSTDDRPARITLDDDKKRDADTPDPDRPTLQRPANTTQGKKQKQPKDTSGVSQAPPPPDEDTDRPTLRRRPAKSDDDPTEAVTTVKGTLLDDPNRPNLHRGSSAGSNDTEDKPLAGLPPDLHQSVAVSDAVDRPEHDFEHHFSAEADRTAIQSKMETLARAVLANPQLAQQTANPTATPDPAFKPSATPPPASAPALPAKPSTVVHTRPNFRRPKAPAVAVIEPAPLAEPQFHAYDLTWNGTPTYVYSAHTLGAGATLQYVTVVAQPDLDGNLQPVLRSLTDETHLDRTPRLRLVDAVDPDASNRASLLFELRASRSRQFSLYRILAGRADQTFLTGSTQ